MAAADTDPTYLGEQLIKAAKDGNETEVERLIAAGADVNIQSKHGTTVLMRAAEKGHTEIAEMLIEKGADVNKQNEKGANALIKAIYYGHTEIAEMLIEKVIDLNLQDEQYGNTALIFAAYKGHKEIAEMLIEKGADVNKQNENGDNALIAAAKEGHKDIIKLLIEKGADVNIQTNYGNTALMWADAEGHTEIVKLITSSKLVEGALRPDMSGHKHGRLAHKAILQAKYPGLSYYDAIVQDTNNIEESIKELNKEFVDCIEYRKKHKELLQKRNYYIQLIDRFNKTGAWKEKPTAFDSFADSEGVEESKTSEDEESSTPINTEDLKQQLVTLQGLLRETQDKITALQIEGQKESDIDNTGKIALEVSQRATLIDQINEIKGKLHSAPIDFGFGTGAAASGGRKKRRTRKHRGKKRKQTKRRKPRKSTRKPKRRVKKRKQTKRRRRR